MTQLLISLWSDIQAFTASELQLDVLRRELGNVDIVVVSSGDEFKAELPDADLVVTWKFRAEWYKYAPRLRAVFTPSAGHDWVQPDPNGRVPAIHGTFHGPLMRESLIAMMLHFNTRLDKLARDKANRAWRRDDLSHCSRLFAQHVVIVGYGSIGRSCAEVLRAFGCRITGIARSDRPPDGLVDAIVSIDKLTSVLPDADHIVFILPGDDSTEGIITRPHFQAMKPTAHIYNLGRGNCYREEDLVQALQSEQIAGAGLDVFATEPLSDDSALWNLPNVIIMPHASAICRHYLDLYVDELIERLPGYLT